MMKRATSLSAVLLFTVWAVSKPLAQAGDSDRAVTEAQYEQWKVELSNWGRWGEHDEIGALNLITPAKRLQAVALVEDGITVSLARDGDTVEAVDNPYPYEHTMLGDQLGPDSREVSRHLPYPSGLARPYQREWRLLQRLYARRPSGY